MSNKPTVLAIEAKLFMADVIPLMKLCGLNVVEASAGNLDVERFESLCNAHHPTFVLTVNFTAEVAWLCSRRNLLYVSWTVDPLSDERWQLVAGTNPANCIAFIHRLSLVENIRATGIDARHLPLAASPQRVPREAAAPSAEARSTDENEGHRDAIPVSFVGNSLTAEAVNFLQHISKAADSATVARADAWLGEVAQSDSERSFEEVTLPPWLEAAGIPSAAVQDLLIGAISHHRRLHFLRSCLVLGVQVWGDDAWNMLGEAFRGRADHGRMLTSIYQRSMVSIDIPRLYQRDIVTMRVFDILACGGVVVCEPTPALSDLFDVGTHLLTYRNASELVTLTRTLLLDAPLRRHLSARGRSHVRDNHRLEHRVFTILEAVRKRVETVPV